jgi:hypothetical protein
LAPVSKIHLNVRAVLRPSSVCSVEFPNLSQYPSAKKHKSLETCVHVTFSQEKRNWQKVSKTHNFFFQRNKSKITHLPCFHPTHQPKVGAQHACLPNEKLEGVGWTEMLLYCLGSSGSIKKRRCHYILFCFQIDEFSRIRFNAGSRF